jgi:hypothetical protein
MQKVWIGSGLTLVLLLAGCGGGDKPDAAKSDAPKAGPAVTIDEATAATVTGKVAFAGEAPVMKAIDMSANPICARHGGSAQSEEVIVNGNKTLKNVFVWIKAGVPAGAWPAPPAPRLDQDGCVYRPHVFGVMAGQNFEITNNDGTNHNIHPMPKINQEWNESQPPKGANKVKSFAREEVMIPMKCNVHPWMRAYVGVVAHPFFAVTGDDGTFTIRGLPPGKYTLQVWHERYGTQEQEITVAPKESKSVDFSYKG